MSCRLTDDAESENRAEHRGDIRYPPSEYPPAERRPAGAAMGGASCEAGAMRGAESVCAGDWVVLRVVGVDGHGGLTAVKMVKYTVKG